MTRYRIRIAGETQTGAATACDSLTTRQMSHPDSSWEPQATSPPPSANGVATILSRAPRTEARRASEWANPDLPLAGASGLNNPGKATCRKRVPASSVLYGIANPGHATIGASANELIAAASRASPWVQASGRISTLKECQKRGTVGRDGLSRLPRIVPPNSADGPQIGGSFVGEKVATLGSGPIQPAR